MSTSIKFSEAFLFEPSRYAKFVLRGRIYQYCGMIVDDGNVIVLATYDGRDGTSYRVFPMSEYSDVLISFI